MNKFFTLLSVFVLSLGCQKNTTTDTSTTYAITVDFQNGFNNDSVLLAFDGKIVASVDSVTTNPIFVIAGSLKFECIPGQYTLSVAVPKDSVRTDTTFVHIEKPLWVGVNYSRELKKMHYVFQYTPFAYR